MKNFRVKRTAVLLTAIALILAAAVGGTVAYLVASTGEVVNTFTPTDVSISVVEEFDGETKTDVSIKNTGDIPAYIRAKVVISWRFLDSEGNVTIHPDKPANTDYTIVWGGTNWDMDTSDGFYYYTKPVAAGGFTDDLIKSCTAIAGKAPEGYNLHVEILAQAIQAVPTSVVQGAWGVTVDGTTISK